MLISTYRLEESLLLQVSVPNASRPAVQPFATQAATAVVVFANQS